MATKKPAPAKAKGKTTQKKAPARRTAKDALAPSGLPWDREHFCLEYCKDKNATQAAIRAGYSEKTAYQQGWRLLRNVEVRARINELMAQTAKQLRIEVSDVLQRMWDTATGDVNDVVRLEHRCCRYCHGIGYEYQWRTAREFREAYDKEIRKKFGTDDLDKLIEVGSKFDEGVRIPGMPTDAGGYGFDETASPDPDCPECSGEGVMRVAMPDTREALSHPLYEGVKQTQHGIEVKIADRGKALEQVARHLQMFKDVVDIQASEELMAAARAISAASPAITPQYVRDNAARLDELNQESY